MNKGLSPKLRLDPKVEAKMMSPILLISMLAVIVMGVVLAVIGEVIGNETFIYMGVGIVMFGLLVIKVVAVYMSTH